MFDLVVSHDLQCFDIVGVRGKRKLQLFLGSVPVPVSIAWRAGVFRIERHRVSDDQGRLYRV